MIKQLMVLVLQQCESDDPSLMLGMYVKVEGQNHFHIFDFWITHVHDECTIQYVQYTH